MSDMLVRAGLEVLGTTAGPPDPEQAWRGVIRGGITPTVAVPDDVPDQLAAVDAQWRRLAEEHGIVDEDGTFLISLPGPQAWSGWTVVRLGENTSLATNLIDEAETFVTAARDGSAVLGVSTEEYEIWLIVL